MFKLPETLPQDIEKFDKLAKEYTQQKISGTEFKAYRVPMGIYEQRKNEVYMARIRATGGVIRPDQLLAIFNIALKHHSNLLHITTRQEIQIQNLELKEVKPLLDELLAVGLATKGGGGNTVRNVLVSVDSGVSKDEVFDTTPYALALTSKVLSEPDSYRMPRKMKIAFSSDGKLGYAAINDVGLVAKIVDGRRGFLVYVGGGGGSKPTVGWKLFDFMPVENLFILVEGMKAFFSDYGNRKNRSKARIRFIFYKYGTEKTLSLIKEYYEKAKATQPLLLKVDEENERPVYDYQPAPSLTYDKGEFELWKKRYVSPQKQEHYNSVTLPVFLGNIPLDDADKTEGWKRLLKFVERFGEYTVRFTPQDIRLRNIPDEALPELFTLIKTFDEHATVPVIVNNMLSCTGSDTCRLGLCFSKGLTRAIRKKLLKSNLDLDQFSKVSIHVSGCPNTCGQPLWADLGFIGKVLRNDHVYPAYQVLLAASRDENPQFGEVIGNVSARDIPEFVARLFKDYLDTATGKKDFRTYLTGEGHEKALQLIEEYKVIPSFEDDKNYYFDWGADQLFSVVKRGQAECAAGVFDMIKVDLDAITINRKKLETEAEPVKINTLLYEIVYAASRMLLVTRGLDPTTTDEVFDMFVKDFINAGLVNTSYINLVETAKAEKAKYNYALRKAEVNSLVDDVITLYNNMDDSLQFKNVPKSSEAKPEKATTEAEKPVEGDKSIRFKDLRGVACPMNFVRVKLELAAMKSDDVLEIWLDDGQPIENVPRSVQGEGHTVLAQEKESDGYWKVIIKKK